MLVLKVMLEKVFNMLRHIIVQLLYLDSIKMVVQWAIYTLLQAYHILVVNIS